jgi:hypothetical protein
MDYPWLHMGWLLGGLDLDADDYASAGLQIVLLLWRLFTSKALLQA